MVPLAEGRGVVEDPYTVSLNVIFLGTLILGFTMFLSGLVLFTAVLFLAVAARLLALTARGLISRAVHLYGARPPGQSSGTGRSSSANDQRAVPTVPRSPDLPGIPGGRTAGSVISGMPGQRDARSGVQDEDPVTAPGVTMNMSRRGLPGGPSAR